MRAQEGPEHRASQTIDCLGYASLSDIRNKSGGANCRTAQLKVSHSAARSFGQGGRRYFSRCPSLPYARDASSAGEPETLMLAHSEAISEKKYVAGRGQAIVGRKNILREKIIRKAPTRAKLRVIECRAVACEPIRNEGAIRGEQSPETIWI